MIKLFEYKIYPDTEKPVLLCKKMFSILLAAFIMLAMLVLCTSCQPDNIENEETESRPAILHLKVTGEEQVDATTRAVSEDAIHDLHILIYDSKGELIGQQYAESSTITINTHSAAGCTIYAIANTGKQNLFNSYDIHSETALKDMTSSITAWDELTKGTHLLMTGSIDKVKIEAGAKTLSGGITVSRITAKVKLDIKANSGIIIKNYAIHDIPLKSYYILRPTTTETDRDDTGNTSSGDDAVKDLNRDWINSPFIDVNASSASNAFYMFENRRGTNIDIKEQNDKGEDNSPNRATYININGTIKGLNVNWKVYLGANNKDNFNIKRNYIYTYDITLNDINTVDSRVIVEPESINLSKEGTANCYLASASNQWYSFDATVRGNGELQDYVAEQYGTVSPGISQMPTQISSNTNATQIPKEIIKDAVIVWETSLGLIENVRWDRGSRHVKFKTGTATGNAVIAVRDASQKILWSWHVWRTNGVDLNLLNQSSSKHVMTISTNTDRNWYATLYGRNDIKRRRTITMLRCNLGAQLDDACHYDTPEGNIGIYSMQYQSGRKDLFPGSTNYSTSEETTIYGYGTSNTYQTSGFKIGDMAVNSNTLSSLSARATLDYSIERPAVFIYGSNDNSGSNWLHNAIPNSPDHMISRCLWGDNNTTVSMTVNNGGLDPDPWGTPSESGKKTIYDPCPAGWRVSAADSWTGLGTDDIISWIGVEEKQLYLKGSYDNGYTFVFGSSTTFCPASGRRFSNGKVIENVGSLGGVWWSSFSIKEGTYFFINSGSGGHLASDMPASYGLPVRCTKIIP